MNKDQLLNKIVIPTLGEIPKGLSVSASTAIMMIIAHESSHGEYVCQIKGPALGLIQMEPVSHNDVWENGDSIWSNAFSLGIINGTQRTNKERPSAERMIYDIRYCVFMARQKLFMVPARLPEGLYDLSKYLKKYWNTSAGKADELDYYNAYFKWE